MQPKLTELKPEFVTTMPEKLEPGKLYIAREYGTAIHICACGECGEETVTPFTPAGCDPLPPEWTLTENGDLVTLDPSIGNFQYPCKSHYWIKENKIVWT